jgi:hypothetical protein
MSETPAEALARLKSKPPKQRSGEKDSAFAQRKAAYENAIERETKRLKESD